MSEERLFSPRKFEEIAADCREKVNNDKGITGEIFIRMAEKFLMDYPVPVEERVEVNPRDCCQIIKDTHIRIEGKNMREVHFKEMKPEDKILFL